MKSFCVYLTCYRGNRLPPFYIGSTSVDKINRGYHGSVGSIKYRKIWKTEIKENSSLFNTSIISYYNTRKEALETERRLQLKLNVVRSPMYTNQAIAAPNGFFGADMKGTASPRFGQKHSNESRALMGKARKGIKTGPNPSKARAGQLNGMFGKIRSLDEKTKLAIARAKHTEAQNLVSYSRKKGIVEREKISLAAKLNSTGSKNPRARQWNVTSPEGDVFHLQGNFKQWCKQKGLPSGSPVLRVDGIRMQAGKWSGWTVERL